MLLSPTAYFANKSGSPLDDDDNDDDDDDDDDDNDDDGIIFESTISECRQIVFNRQSPSYWAQDEEVAEKRHNLETLMSFALLPYPSGRYFLFCCRLSEGLLGR